jgi:hypothetical protein
MTHSEVPVVHDANWQRRALACTMRSGRASGIGRPLDRSVSRGPLPSQKAILNR